MDVKDHKAMLPPDLYLINQVGLSNHHDIDGVTSEITELRRDIVGLPKSTSLLSKTLTSK